MRIIKFCREGEAISDFEVEERVKTFLSSDIQEWKVSSHTVLDCLRVAVKEKTINYDDYQFIVQDLSGKESEFVVDKDGRSSDWVDSQDVWSNIVMKIL